ncbi:MAG: hypothetical protein LUE29_11245 [Lachnospiraceae bacterium]|nr:hypothetical protein [Lachnospiraceae bacterium]
MYLSKYNAGHHKMIGSKTGTGSFPRTVIRAFSAGLHAEVLIGKRSLKRRKHDSQDVSRVGVDSSAFSGSVTVEAALVLPIVIFTFLSFFYFFTQIRFEMIMQDSFTSTGVTGALVYGAEEQGEEALDEFAGTELATLLSGTGAGLVRGLALSSYVYSTNSSAISPFITGRIGGGGIKNFSLLGSSYDMEASEGTLSVTYKFTLPWVGKAFSGQTSVQSGYFHSWVGRSMKDEVTWVYMTPNGSVYHLTTDCTYLTKRIQTVSLETAKTKKNAYGISYTACTSCSDAGTQSGGNVYITTYGTKYHYDINCTAITHDIRRLTLEEAQESYPLCSKCAKESGD